MPTLQTAVLPELPPPFSGFLAPPPHPTPLSLSQEPRLACKLSPHQAGQGHLLNISEIQQKFFITNTC